MVREVYFDLPCYGAIPFSQINTKTFSKYTYCAVALGIGLGTCVCMYALGRPQNFRFNSVSWFRKGPLVTFLLDSSITLCQLRGAR